VELVCGEMLAAAAPYARWVDVFCEKGAFDADQSRAVLEAGIAAGLMPRVHANQLGPGPGVQLAVSLGAASADHCTHLSPSDVDALASSATVATLLPGAEFSPARPIRTPRRLLAAGVTVALATDCNPGSSYTSSMPFCLALAVREMRMTPAEALWSADPRRRPGAAPHRRRPPGHRRPGRPVGARRAVLPPPPRRTGQVPPSSTKSFSRSPALIVTIHSTRHRPRRRAAVDAQDQPTSKLSPHAVNRHVHLLRSIVDTIDGRPPVLRRLHRTSCAGQHPRSPRSGRAEPASTP
jgi:hypothetical protein